LSVSEFEVLLYEFKADLNAYLKTLGGKAPVKSMAEIIAFNEKNAAREMPFSDRRSCSRPKPGAISIRQPIARRSRETICCRARGEWTP
jgi:hypothetical protein